MRLSGLVVATLFFSSVAFAQHSGSSGSSGSFGGGGGGGSHSSSSGGSSSSSGSSGGGSHGGSSGGGASSSHASGGSHSSGGGHESSGGRGSTGSNSRGSVAFASGANGKAERSVADMVRSGDIRVTEIRAVNEKNEPVILDKQSTREVVKMVKAGKPEEQIREYIRTRVNASSPPPGAKPEIREHKGFWGLLRHPSRKPEGRLVVDLRRPVCLRGPCQICPGGEAKAGGCGVGTVIPRRAHQGCSGRAVWTGSPCILQTHYLDDCSGLRTMLERQGQRMQAAESIRQSACAATASSECSEAATSWQSEQNLYSSLQQRYQQCRVQGGYSSRLRGFDPAKAFGSFYSFRFDAAN